MQITNITKTRYSLKDNLKGQKIVAAMYLVTNHLSDNDPFKSKLRLVAISLIETNSNNLRETVENIQGILSITALANIISQKNVTMLNSALGEYLIENSGNSNIAQLFETFGQKDITDKIDHNKDKMSFTKIEVSDSKKTVKQSIDNKSKRQNEILAFVNKNKSVGIKDIAAIFPDISEKTVQREVGHLVDKGLITKRGNKRWSVYLAINK